MANPHVFLQPCPDSLETAPKISFTRTRLWTRLHPEAFFLCLYAGSLIRQGSLDPMKTPVFENKSIRWNSIKCVQRPTGGPQCTSCHVYELGLCVVQPASGHAWASVGARRAVSRHLGCLPLPTHGRFLEQLLWVIRCNMLFPTSRHCRGFAQQDHSPREPE